MPISIYTHDFNIALGDGGKFITGEMVVDKTSKKTTQKILTSSDPLPLEFFEDALALIRQLSDLFIKYDGLKRVEFKEKV